MGRYDFSSLSSPTPLQSVGPFALRNNMSINAYDVDDDKEVIYPLRASSTLVPDRHVDLILFERDGVHPYTTIRDFSRLVGRQLSNHGHIVHCCRPCLHASSRSRLLPCAKDPLCRFTNIQKQLMAPFLVYADIESILQRIDEAMDTTQGVAVGGDEPTPLGPFQEHLPCSFAYKVVSSVVSDFSRPLVSHRGEDAREMFVRKLQEEAEQLFQGYIDTPQLLEFTDAELGSFHTGTNCHICNQSLGGARCVIIVTLWGTIVVLRIVGVT